MARSNRVFTRMIQEDIMHPAGPMAEPTRSTSRAEQQRTREINHVEHHYKSIGISAVVSALSVLKSKNSAPPVKREPVQRFHPENMAA